MIRRSIPLTLQLTAVLLASGCGTPRFFAKADSNTPAPQLGLELSPQKPAKKPPPMDSQLADVPTDPAAPKGTLLTRWLTTTPSKSIPAKRQPLPLSEKPAASHDLSGF